MFANWFGELSGKETGALVILLALMSVCLLFLLGCCCNIVDICSATCCGMCCGHKDPVETDTTTVADRIEDGFVKLGDF
jgi:hypothetical protein